MGNQIKGLMYFFLTDVRYSLIIFWSILLGAVGLSLFISYFLLGVDNARFYFGFPSATYFYCAILGFLTVKDTIPFALKMGATRKNLYFTIGLFFLVIAFAKAVFGSTLHAITLLISDAAGLRTFHLVHLSQFISDTWINRVIIDTAVMFLLLAFMFIIGLVFYRAGLLGGGSLVAFIALILLLGIAQGWLIDHIGTLFADIQLIFFIQLFGIGVVLYMISYLFTRRITVIKAK